jgi:hypothetical protein
VTIKNSGDGCRSARSLRALVCSLRSILAADIDHSDPHTAVLFFSHRPGRSWTNKQFVRQDYAKHRRVAEAFYEHSLRAARDSGFPVLEMTDQWQRGTGFGPRFANAVADAFAQGYDRVIAVGSDCPRLHEVDWAGVEDQLAEGAPVLGPTPDRDGTYLIGLRREHFDKALFEALPWTTADLFPALTQHLERQAGTAPVLLAPRDDVNGHRDLLALLRRRSARGRPLLHRVRQILGHHRSLRAVRSVRSRTRGRHRRARAPPTAPTVT